jgi:hypothetical protein
MMRRVIVFILVVIFLFSHTGFASAQIWYNTVWNWSGGQRGVASDVYILNRHDKDEYYLIMLYSKNDSLGTWTAFGWEITDIYHWSDPEHYWFDPYWHIIYPNGDEDDRIVDKDLEPFEWYRLKMHDYGEYVYLYLDYIVERVLYWPYVNRNGYTTTTRTQLEVEPYSSPYFFMGRHHNIWIRLSNGSWTQQGPSWGNRIYSWNNPLDNPYDKFIWNAYYWDWEARIP